jgi:hypothetical protein
VTESNTSNLSILHCPPKLELSGDYHKILSGSIFLLCRKIDSIKELDLAKISISWRFTKSWQGKVHVNIINLNKRTEKEHQIHFDKISTLQHKLFSFRRHILRTWILLDFRQFDFYCHEHLVGQVRENFTWNHYWNI